MQARHRARVKLPDVREHHLETLMTAQQFKRTPRASSAIEVNFWLSAYNGIWDGSIAGLSDGILEAICAHSPFGAGTRRTSYRSDSSTTTEKLWRGTATTQA